MTKSVRGLCDPQNKTEFRGVVPPHKKSFWNHTLEPRGSGSDLEFRSWQKRNAPRLHRTAQLVRPAASIVLALYQHTSRAPDPCALTTFTHAHVTYMRLTCIFRYRTTGKLHGSR